MKHKKSYGGGDGISESLLITGVRFEYVCEMDNVKIFTKRK
jgi:hypothetical protein